MKQNPYAQPSAWDALAQGYAAEMSWVMDSVAEEALDRAGLPPDARVLDVGAGPGPLALLGAGRVGSVHAVDFSAEMLTQLQAGLRDRKINNVTLEQGDGQHLSQPDGSFDAAFSLFGLMFFPDRTQGFSELHRVLRPGGLAVVSSWACLEQNSLLRLMFDALAAAVPEMPEPTPTGLEIPETFESELNAAGFNDVSVESYVVRRWEADTEQFWARMARAFGPAVLLRQQLEPVEWERRVAIARSFLAQELKEPKELTMTVLYGIGRRP